MSVATVEGARVIHALPGRIRVHFPGWSGHGQWKVERRVRGLPGVRHVEANGLTGNVLIRFDPAASDEQTLLAAVADAAKDTETLLEDGPFPPVLEETVEGTVRRARVAVRGIDRDPQMARFVVNHLRRLFKVHAWASPLTGRVMIEYDDSRVGLNELLAYVRQVELPELPGEDRPAHPLDPAPLVQSASRTAAAGLGLAVLAVWRWAGGPVAPGRIKAAATAAGVITLLNGFPSLRNGLRRLLGRHTADVFFSIAGVVTLTLARSPLGLAIVGAEALVLLTEVVARRAAWTRYEEHMEGAGAAEPGAVIRLEAGECAPLTARVIEGVGTATGRDGLPLRIVPGSEVLAGARLFAGPFVVQLTGGEAFLPGPRPGNLAPSFLGRYLKVLGPLSLGYAALSLVLTRSPARAFTALLLVNPRVALVGLEAANLYAAARVLRGGVTVVETRPERVVQLPDVLLLDRPRVLTDGLEVAGVMPSAGSLDATAIMALASGVSAGAGSPWGNAFPRVGSETATDGSFNGLWAKARVMGEDYTLGPPEDPPEVPGAFALQYRGGYLLALCRGGHWEQPLGLLALRPRLSPRAAELVQTCKRRGVCLKVVPRGSRLGAQAVARRAGVELTASDDAVAVVRELQQQGKLVALVSDSALAAPAFAACDLAIGLTPSSLGRFPARVDLLAADLGAVAAILEAGVHRDVTVRDAVLLSAAANVFGAVWGFRDRPGVERASLAVYAAALAALADGWVRMQGGARAGSSLHYLVDPRPERWGRQAAANALRAFRTSEAGLAFGEAAKRQRAVPQSTRRHEVLTSILDQLGSPVNAILGGGAILSFAIGGEGLEVIIIAATVALNTVLGAWQEHQAGRATEAMRQLGTATARVLRDGAPAVVPASDVVPGDILLVEPGDRVPADARLLTAHGLEVDEAPLTGESVPVSKHVEQGPPEARIVLEGSDVAVGTGRAVVVAVGRQTRLGSIAAALDLDETRQSTFGSRLSRLMQLSLPVAAAGGITVFAAGLLWGKPAFSQLGVGVSIALAVVPESLPLLAGTGQVGVARRLADRRVLLRRLSAVEALGRVDVACADKTGTLTEGRLSVRLVADSEHEALLATLADDGLRQVLLTAALASPHPDAAGASAHRTDVAIVQAARDAGLFEALSPGRRGEAPFDPGRPFHATALADRVCVKGAPEEICLRCTRLRRGDCDSPLDEAGRQALLDRARSLADRGLRVLMVAEGSPDVPLEDPGYLVALGFISISDPLRPSVPAAVQRCREAGVRLVMITGDHPATARAIAREAGILDEDGEILTGGELAELPEDELDRRLEQAPVIARATPLDKLRIIEGLRRRGHVVAMTGDGVNDAPALRLADVGVAMGRGGTEVARQAAAVVLTDDDFSTLVETFVEGRSFWRNMRRALSLLLGGNVGELGLIVGATVLGFTSPLNTRQILVVNLITDALPALSVAMQRPEHRNLAALAREGTSALDASLRRDVMRRGAATSLPALAAYIITRRTGSREEAGSTAFGAIVMNQLAQTLDAGWSEGNLNRSVLGAVGGSAGMLLATLSVRPLRDMLGLTALTPLGWGLIGTASLAAVAISRGFSSGNFPLAFSPDLAHDPKEKTNSRLPS